MKKYAVIYRSVLMENLQYAANAAMGFVSYFVFIFIFFTTGSSPMVGSSRKSTLGLWIREAAISHRMRWPRERFRTGVLIKAPSSKSSAISLIRFSPSSSGIS